MKLLVLLSHELQDKQVVEINELMGIKEIVRAPDSVMKVWSNISPKGELAQEDLEPVISWIGRTSSQGDRVLVQGEFGATFYVVEYCFERKLRPIYSTTERKVVEEVQGDKVIAKRVFSHVTFRSYLRYGK